MSDKPQIHTCNHIGVTFDDVTFELLPNHGKPCWKATAKIGTLFGSEVEGECLGIGRTKDEALARLKEDQRNLADSLWA
jgi:hypothetical protein